MGNSVKHAIILAGGKGERLRPFTNDRPKPMVEIGGKPILLYIIEQLKKAGIEEIVFACSYLHEVIEEYLGDGSKFGIKASYSIEENPLGRGGGIKQAMKFLSENWEDVVVTNGDQLWNIDITQLIQKHQKKQSIATVVTIPLKSPYGIVEFNENDEILGFREKPELPHWINAGIYVFSREIELLLPTIGDHETETFPMLPKERFIVFQSIDYWKGVDTIKDLTEAEKEVSAIFGVEPESRPAIVNPPVPS